MHPQPVRRWGSIHKESWNRGEYLILEPLPAEPSIDWSRFVPTEEIPVQGDSSYLRMPKGTVYASWTSGEAGYVGQGGSVWRAGEAWLAGAKDGSGSRWRIIRHADGRWAPGYGPDGPIGRESMHCNACGGPCDGPCEEGDEQFENIGGHGRYAPTTPSEPANAPLKWVTMNGDLCRLAVEAAQKRVDRLRSDFSPQSMSAEALLFLYDKRSDLEARLAAVRAALDKSNDTIIERCKDLAVAKKERDEWKAHAETERRQHGETLAALESAALDTERMRKERDEAAAKLARVQEVIFEASAEYGARPDSGNALARQALLDVGRRVERVVSARVG